MTEDTIIELFNRRDEAAIDAVQEQYGDYCRSIAERILHNEQDCEECVNETWFRAWTVIPPQRPKSLRMFLASITRNLAFSKYRCEHAMKRGKGEIDLILDELSECIGTANAPEENLLAKELDFAVNQFLRQLSRRDRNVFLRRYFFTETAREIADRYALREENVRVILMRTRKKLKSYLKKEEYL